MKNSNTSIFVSHYIIREIKKVNTQKMKILDVGCGTGEYIPYFKGQVVGIDYDVALLKIAKKHFSKVIFKRHDCTKFPLPIKGKVDLIFSTELVEHLQDKDAIKLMNEFERISQGYIFISTPNVNNFTSLLRFIMFRSIAIAGKPNLVESILYILKYKRRAPRKSKYPVVEESLLSNNPHKQLHYHVSSFNSSFFRKRGYKVVGGLGFVSYNAIKNRQLRNYLDKFFYYFPYFAGDILAIKKVA